MSKKTRSVIIKAVLVLLIISIFVAVAAIIVQSFTGPTFATDRFVEVYSELNGYAGLAVVVDKETGIQYLWAERGYKGGLTPLLGSNGEVTYYHGDLGE